jgi:ABC-type transporter Mla maintaining outer membrane lipid asymmetry permease subunit MlaE
MFSSLGSYVLGLCRDTGGIAVLSAQVGRALVPPRLDGRMLLEQLYKMGNRSLAIVALAAFFAGALMAISGTRALLMALPPMLVGGSFAMRSMPYLPGFALGILVGMGVFGLFLAEGLARLNERISLWVYRGVAVSSMALGLTWMGMRL